MLIERVSSSPRIARNAGIALTLACSFVFACGPASSQEDVSASEAHMEESDPAAGKSEPVFELTGAVRRYKYVSVSALGVRVTLEGPGTFASVAVDKAGRYRFSGLPRGQYVVSFIDADAGASDRVLMPHDDDNAEVHTLTLSEERCAAPAGTCSQDYSVP